MKKYHGMTLGQLRLDGEIALVVLRDAAGSLHKAPLTESRGNAGVG
jgi:hypothetical protein